MEEKPTPSKRRIARPLGIYVITSFDGLFIGLLPLILLLALDNDPSIKISEFDYYLTAALRVIVVASALAAMMGDHLGRRILLWAVTAASISMILNSVGVLSNGEGTATQGIGLVGSITRGIFWIGINWWYFNRKEVAEYYQQNRQAKQHEAA